MRSDLQLDKARARSPSNADLSGEHFVELIEERIRDCEAWEGKLRSQGNFKEADRMMKTKEQMLKSLKRLNGINQRANKQNI
ncbi:Uncharacterised protein [uncultured archaeon]|nr:Uncharacterised protein [uncultured archaeon]